MLHAFIMIRQRRCDACMLQLWHRLQDPENLDSLSTVLVIGCSLNEEVEVNFGSKPFRFDLDGQLQQERDRQAAAIAA